MVTACQLHVARIAILSRHFLHRVGPWVGPWVEACYRKSSDIPCGNLVGHLAQSVVTGHFGQLQFQLFAGTSCPHERPPFRLRLSCSDSAVGGRRVEGVVDERRNAHGQANAESTLQRRPIPTLLSGGIQWNSSSKNSGVRRQESPAQEGSYPMLRL
jgi:hypothetical protein